MKAVGHKQTSLLEMQGYGHDMVEPALPILLNTVRELSKSNTVPLNSEHQISPGTQEDTFL